MMNRKLFVPVSIAALLLMSLLSGCKDDTVSAQPVTTTTQQTRATTTTAQVPTRTELMIPTAPNWTNTPAPTTTQSTSGPCVDQGINSENWNIDEDVNSMGVDSRPGIMSQGVVDGLAFSPGRCFDTMVIKVATPDAVGFDVRYLDGPVTQIASGQPIPVNGQARLYFVVTAHLPENADLVNGFGYTADSRFKSLKQVVFAGYQEGRVAFGVGVAGVRKFGVIREPDPDRPGNVQIVLRVTHVPS
jgi:hypothetical protein